MVSCVREKCIYQWKTLQNSLALDQAKRIAELVDGSEELKSAGIRVGMYVGGEEHSSAKMIVIRFLIDDIGLGMCLGVMMGVSIGPAIDVLRKNKKSEEQEDNDEKE